MKFIKDKEAEAIRAARKALDNLCKRYGKLREKAANVCKGQNDDHYQMFKELSKLKVDVGLESDGEGGEAVWLSLGSKEWLIEYLENMYAKN